MYSLSVCVWEMRSLPLPILARYCFRRRLSVCLFVNTITQNICVDCHEILRVRRLWTKEEMITFWNDPQHISDMFWADDSMPELKTALCFVECARWRYRGRSCSLWLQNCFRLHWHRSSNWEQRTRSKCCILSEICECNRKISDWTERWPEEERFRWFVLRQRQPKFGRDGCPPRSVLTLHCTTHWVRFEIRIDYKPQRLFHKLAAHYITSTKAKFRT